MNSRSLGATRVFAWDTAVIAVMGAVAAIRVLKRRELAAVPEDERPALEARLAAEHEKVASGLHSAIELGVVDEIISPKETRGAIARVLAQATPARGAHGNIPL
jgi:acetyl-CoA/propionyl-CoA carboxylase carboxyl transferase subunit